jgi:thiosulfate dehydrogenase [quinone] large subunit
LDIEMNGVKMTNSDTQTARIPRKHIVTDPPFAQTLFGDWRLAWIWLIVRLYVGYQWISAGYEKIINPAWVGSQAGTALTGFLNNAISLTSGAHLAVQGWYASFLQRAILPGASTWSYVIAFGETLVGAGLILGVFTGIAAFFGFFMNFNYLMAGTVSINPVLLFLSLILLLAWKTAGWWGLDRWVLVDLGTPWSPGLAFQTQKTREAPAPSPEVKGTE